MQKIKYRRKNGIGFATPILKPQNNEIIIVNNHQEHTIQEYFSSLIDAYKIRMHVLNDLVKQIQKPIRIKVTGTGICGQARIIEGCVARMLLNLLSDETIKQETKDMILPQYELLKTLAKSDLRIVERKKPGFKKARKKKPTNKR